MTDQEGQVSVVIHAALVGNARGRTLTVARHATRSPRFQLLSHVVMVYERHWCEADALAHRCAVTAVHKSGSIFCGTSGALE